MTYKYYIRITDVEKRDFSFYGNECEYSIEIYNKSKKKIGEHSMYVLQGGTDYESVYEELYDICESGDKDEIAAYLGVEEVPEDWFDEDGQIDVSNLPEDVHDHICSEYDQTLIDYYLYEDFAEEEDENGLIPLEVFCERLTFGEVGHTREIDTELLPSEMFANVGGYYQPEIWQPEEGFVSLDVTSVDGKSLFIKITAIVAQTLENLDLVSGYVNVRFDGDYSKEKEAQRDMNYIYVEIAYIIIRSILPQINDGSKEGMIKAFQKTITNIGRRLAFIYSDDEIYDIEDIYENVYNGVVNKRWPKTIYEEKFFNDLVSAFIAERIYPETNEKYAARIEDRGLGFLKYCIE